MRKERLNGKDIPITPTGGVDDITDSSTAFGAAFSVLQVTGSGSTSCDLQLVRSIVHYQKQGINLCEYQGKQY